jgi:hypothetical protein
MLKLALPAAEEEPMRGYEVHAAKLVDIPLVRRLAEKGTMLDSELCYTREASGPHSVLLSSILLPQRGLYTLVGRADKQHVIGQFRLKPDDHLAQIVYMAPSLEEDMCDTAWLALMDAMAYEAGRRGAHILTTEVNEDSPLFVTMRQAGFAVYARQEIWRRAVNNDSGEEIALSGEMYEETDDDQMDIQLLYSNIVPRLVQAITVPSRDSKGLVYRKANRVQAYIAVSEGKTGVYIMPYLHPDVLGHEASAIIAAVIDQCSRADRVPVYVCVRRYQDWLTESLSGMGFEAWTQQAVMVRHIAAGIRQTNFAPLMHKSLEAVPHATPVSKSKLTNQEKPST